MPNYIKKISIFNFKEKISILRFTIGSRLINSVPRGIKNSYLLSNRLLNNGIITKRKGECLEFQYPLNQKAISFQLKRDSSDAQVFEQIIELGEYLPILAIFRDKNITPHTMIDAGANIGLTCLYFKSHFPDLVIIALEPSNETFNRLEQNIHINQFSSVTLLKKGLWSSQTRLKADTSFRDGQDWSFRLVEASENEAALIETSSIDAIISEQKLTSIDFLKIDIEGGEVEVFKDFSQIQWLDKVKVLALEIHDEFDCREHIESNLKHYFELSYSGELTIGINKNLK
jgi:FkbM family methyltransferase